MRGVGLVGLFGIGLAALVVAAGHSASVSPETDRWLRQVRLGPYADAQEKLEALREAAKQEGKVVVYTSTSRVGRVKKLFEETYPGITLEVFDMENPEVVEKIAREQRAGAFTGDVMLAGDGPTLIGRLLNQQMIWNYVPPLLKPAFPAQFQSPLLVHRLGANVVYYNSEAHTAPPVGSWWDLTRPEWRNRLVVYDPLGEPDVLALFTMMVKDAALLEEDYRRVFGQALKLTTPNAGYELIKGILRNRPTLMKTDDDVARAVGTRGQARPLLGIGGAYSKVRVREEKNLAFEVVTGLTPRAGILTLEHIAVINRAPHPNAAKLLIQFLLGDNKGGGGFAPWFVAGNWPARSDIKELPKLAIPLPQLNAWVWDAEFSLNHRQQVRDFWLSNL